MNAAVAAAAVTDGASFGPYGRCIRALHPDGYGENQQHRCKEPACNDLGWCAPCLTELQTW